MTNTLLADLQQHPFLEGMSPAALCLMSGYTARARFDTGRLLTRAGANADRFYLIQEGQVQVAASSPTSPQVVHTAAQGEIVGWACIAPPYRYRFDTSAATPTDVLVVDGSRLRAEYDRHPDLGYPLLLRITAALGARLQDLQLRLLDCYGARCR